METIITPGCAILAGLLSDYGITRAVLSPGSRNAPLIEALTDGRFETTVIIDERCAAFAALGMSTAGQPAVLVCTSGTALFDYAPAVAEAFYRRVPLIVVSADRPEEWIDQRDSQTIRQPGALAAIVRRSVDIREDMADATVNRLVNDAIADAFGPIAGPVHINMHLSLRRDEPRPVEWRRFLKFRADAIAQGSMKYLFDDLTLSGRIMLVVGSTPGLRIPSALLENPSVAVVAELNANLEGPDEIFTPNLYEPVLRKLSQEECNRPEYIISIGGALISDGFKKFLRASGAKTIGVGFDDCFVDTFLNLYAQVHADPQVFLDAWAAHTQDVRTDYRDFWADTGRRLKARIAGEEFHRWSDLGALLEVEKYVPRGTTLFLGNGMSARYGQLVPWRGLRAVYANRGVSGIDGCTSTAAGVSMVTPGQVLLVTGDMGFAYDIGALALPEVGSTLKIVVLDNGGGDIFRRIRTTRDLPHRDECFVARPCLPLSYVSTSYGFSYFYAAGFHEAAGSIEAFFAEDVNPAILHIRTTEEDNTSAYNRLHSIKP